jgi:hypothetical protein
MYDRRRTPIVSYLPARRPLFSCARYRYTLYAALGDRIWIQGNQAGHAENAKTLRSVVHGLVPQEVWGTLIAYNLMHYEIAKMAEELQIPLHRFSFVWLGGAITTTLYH